MIDLMGEDERTETLISRLEKSEDNDEFLESLKTA
jgi:transcription termination factor Rho